MSDFQFDWEDVANRPVLAVVARNERRMSDGSLAWDALALAVGDDAIMLTVTGDTDEVLVTHAPVPSGEDWVAVSAFSDLLGKPLGWCWIGANYRGYCDTFSLALGDVVPDALQPRLTFVAEGASLTCYDLKLRKA